MKNDENIQNAINNIVYYAESIRTASKAEIDLIFKKYDAASILTTQAIDFVGLLSTLADGIIIQCQGLSCSLNNTKTMLEKNMPKIDIDTDNNLPDDMPL
jgi:hypothetical protein